MLNNVLLKMYSKTIAYDRRFLVSLNMFSRINIMTYFRFFLQNRCKLHSRNQYLRTNNVLFHDQTYNQDMTTSEYVLEVEKRESLFTLFRTTKQSSIQIKTICRCIYLQIVATPLSVRGSIKNTGNGIRN